ncbi:MAG: fibronectin type III domain-containing protein [Alphaproteobacteria bacterium]|nr:MAG: fibronectin type III domain-containing protein [Alphaproteobacteria bacterium]
MGWYYNVTNNSTPPTPNNYSWYGLNTLNQDTALIWIGGTYAVTKIRVLVNARSSNCLARLAIWLESNGYVVAQTDTFAMTVGTESIGGQAWQEISLPSPVVVNAANYYVGVYRNPSGAHISGTHTSLDGYLKTNTNGFPSIVGMAGYSTDGDESILVGVFLISAPLTPSNLVATRNSDTNISFTFTNPTTADNPYDSVTVRRWDNVTNGWYTIATLGGSATSYTDTTVSANKTYRYAVIGYNTLGYSPDYAYSDYVNTTPSAPSNVVAISSGSSVVLSWVDNSTNENGFKIQSSEYSGGTWQAWQDETTVSANTTSWTDTTPPNIVKYQVRAYTNVYGSLNSSYASSNELTILQAPSAPSNLSPDSTYFDATAAKVFTWQHNPLDGSAQTKYSIQYKVEGGSYPGTPQVNQTVSGTSSHSFAGGTFTNGTTYKYQVKTWGAYSTGSAWSTEKTFYCEDIPVGTITSPTTVSDYATSLLTMTWSFTGNLQIEFLAKLYDSNDVLLETQSIASDAETVNFTTLLLNTSTYTVTLQVKDSTGLWSVETSVEFDTSFAVPPTPTFTLTANESNGTVVIDIVNPSPEGAEVEAVSNNVYRSTDGANYYLILDEVGLNTSVTDYIPVIGITCYYIVESVSATPTVAQATNQIVTLTCLGLYFLNSGENYLNYVILSQNVELSDKPERETVLQKFEGRNYPVKYQSETLGQEINFSCDILVADLEDVKAIVQSSDDLFFRDHSGRWFDCAIISASFTKQENGRVYNFKCNIIQIEKE